MAEQKVGILTHYNVNNQGAQLQLYALYRVLEGMGYEPYVLTYSKNFDFGHRDKQKRNIITPASVPYILREFLWRKGPRLTWHNVRKYRLNGRFRRSNFRFAHYARTPMDMAVVGSDEVFSLDNGVNIMMFGHGVNARRVVAYAPSFGQTDGERITDLHCRALIRSGLDTFHRLSARDGHTQALIREMTGREARRVCDPVMLYDFPRNLAPCRRIGAPYMIVYAYDRYLNDEKDIGPIIRYARSHNLLIVSPGTYHAWCDRNIACDPLQWVEYFRGARAVVTNTFHGTVLSIVTNTPMAVCSERYKIVGLLEEMGLQSRRMNDFGQVASVLDESLDADAMNEKWQALRRGSMEYLREALAGGCEEETQCRR